METTNRATETTVSKPNVEELRARCAILIAARDVAPEQLSATAWRVLRSHETVASELGITALDVYATGTGLTALAEELPADCGWWEDAEAPKPVQHKRYMCDVRRMVGLC